MPRTYRFEFKYEISPRQAYFIEKVIKRFGMKPDANIISGDGEYFVTSLYFDSYNLSDYSDKAGGFIKRKKFRLRIYEPYLESSKFIWLEIKNKLGSQNSKTRIKLSKLELEQFLKDGARTLLLKNWKENELVKKDEIIRSIIKSSITPKLMVRYIRRAFTDDVGDVRITFDSDLETCRKTDLNRTGVTTRVNPGKLVMEVKFCYLIPYWFRVIVQEFGLKVDTYSKYERSIEAVHRYNPLPR